MEAILMMRPQRRSSIPGSSARLSRNGAVAFTARWCSQSAGSVRAMEADSAIPALLTRMSMRGRAARIRSSPAARARGSATSISQMTIAAAPASFSSAATASSWARVRAVMATAAPARPRARATARPMPRPPPVTSATLPDSVVCVIRARLYYPGSMARRFEKATASDAIGRLRPGMKVLLPAGCGDPTALVREIMRQSERVAPLTLMGGLRLDDYPFGAAAYAGKLRFTTWHLSPRLHAAEARGDAEYVPARYFDAVSFFAAGGPAPPDRAGYLSLGVSVSYALPAARRAPLVIAQVNARMPRTLGNAFLHRTQVDVWVEVDEPLLEYPPTPVGEVERKIAAHVAGLIPDGATVQVGIGAIPQAVMEALGGKKDLGVHSLLVDHMLPLIEAGVITNARKRLHPGRMDIGEIMGT